MLCDFWARIALIESSERVHSVWGEMGTQASLNHHNDNGFIFVSLLSFTKQNQMPSFNQNKKMMCLICKPQPQSVLIFQRQSINQISTQLTVTDTQWMSEIWCDLWGWDTESSSQAINQSINQSIRVVTRKSVRNVNDKIMEYKSSCCGTETVKNHW